MISLLFIICLFRNEYVVIFHYISISLQSLFYSNDWWGMYILLHMDSMESIYKYILVLLYIGFLLGIYIQLYKGRYIYVSCIYPFRVLRCGILGQGYHRRNMSISNLLGSGLDVCLGLFELDEVRSSSIVI